MRRKFASVAAKQRKRAYLRAYQARRYANSDFTFGTPCTRNRIDTVFPRVAEPLGRMKLLQKGVAIGLMLVGGYLISR